MGNTTSEVYYSQFDGVKKSSGMQLLSFLK